jgi:hypothetical protein
MRAVVDAGDTHGSHAPPLPAGAIPVAPWQRLAIYVRDSSGALHPPSLQVSHHDL